MKSEFVRVAPWVNIGETPKKLLLVSRILFYNRALEVEVVCPIFGVIGRTETFDELIPEWVGNIVRNAQVEQVPQHRVVD